MNPCTRVFLAAEHTDWGAPSGGHHRREMRRRGSGGGGVDPGHRGDVHGRGPRAAASHERRPEDAGGGDPVPLHERAVLRAAPGAVVVNDAAAASTRMMMMRVTNFVDRRWTGNGTMHAVRPHGWASAKILVSYRIHFCAQPKWFLAQSEIVFLGEVHREISYFVSPFAFAVAVRQWLMISLR
jgi:hypothetical protein